MSQFDHVLSRQPVASSYPSTTPASRKNLPAFRPLAAAPESPPLTGNSMEEVSAVPNNAATDATSSDYRTTIHFLTSPSPSSAATMSGSTSVTASAMDIDTKNSPSLNSVPVSALLSSNEAIQGYHSPYQNSASNSPPRHPNVSLPPIHISRSPQNSSKYRDDELTGMAGLMELAGPESSGYMHSADSSRYSSRAYAPNSTNSMSRLSSHNEPYTSSNSTNSAGSYGVPPALNTSSSHHQYLSQQQRAEHQHPQPLPIPQSRIEHPHYYQQHHQQQQTGAPRFTMHHSSNSIGSIGSLGSIGSIGSPHSASQTMMTPDSMASSNMHNGTRSFPATVDDVQMARHRSHSTDSMHSSMYIANSGGNNSSSGVSALPCVLGNANIRNRSYTQTQTQRQRTSDTPLFPILLHRIINDPNNESWIRWCEDGKAFKFSSADNLLACLQAAGLRAQNYHSIEKNLNDYRFSRLTDQRRKIPDSDGKLWWMFSHPQFLRSNPDGIVNIQRRRRTNPPAPSPQPAHQSHPHSQISLQSQGHYPLPPSAPSSTRQGPF
ncbi:Heat shock transcription factor [Coemansia interrupta]|uniref:Heat shock transcription factor n=1 Tax=Coemansia interrupta TaxID=1126814 RepID=A0A9W8HNJ1_9FUNG|nr:Heat shock transcription factor [Coemansia interrupta]